MKWLRNLRLTAVVALAVMVLGGGIASGAPATEPTTGQPGAKAENHCGEGGLVTPGNYEQAKGSPFDPAGVAGEHYAGNLGTKSREHSAVPGIAESQYDVACLRVTTNH
jgi:hypothetical protein